MVAHSQGTTAFFVMASDRPEYQEKVIASFTLAPVTFMTALMDPLIQLSAPYTDAIYVRFKI